MYAAAGATLALSLSMVHDNVPHADPGRPAWPYVAVAAGWPLVGMVVLTERLGLLPAEDVIAAERAAP